ncbi:MAG: hypothetical protein IJM83_10505 [Firmicutes bacterium]|nr:hypothetical protein [Bacillota bacterium]
MNWFDPKDRSKPVIDPRRQIESKYPDMEIPAGSFEEIASFFREKGYPVLCEPTVTTDAVYRQTFQKEQFWREKGCVAVDMEASALVNLCNLRGIKNTVVLMISDRHPIREEDSGWSWGGADFAEITRKFILDSIEFSIDTERRNGNG